MLLLLLGVLMIYEALKGCWPREERAFQTRGVGGWQGISMCVCVSGIRGHEHCVAPEGGAEIIGRRYQETFVLAWERTLSSRTCSAIEWLPWTSLCSSGRAVPEIVLSRLFGCRNPLRPPSETTSEEGFLESKCAPDLRHPTQNIRSVSLSLLAIGSHTLHY